ncbi:MAG: hypothetical protein D6B27_00665 [Gammaproteobacteria bacterium]|nr:MAG: hypothetical protein D6B27_00665 [Gammaproteobacteria bacterium]
MIINNIQLVVIADDAAITDKAGKLAQQFGFQIIDGGKGVDGNADEMPLLFLEVSAKGVSLFDKSIAGKKPVYVDFCEGKMAHRTNSFSVKNQNLLRAIGIKKGNRPTVIDATAGLGSDSFIMAWAGCSVTAIERSAVVYALLEDGLCRARTNPETADIADRITLLHGDSAQLISSQIKASQINLSQTKVPDVVYIDPMFPERSKKALVKKEMRVVKEIVGEDVDSERIFRTARKVAKQRVVVKRPLRGEFLCGAEPDFSYKGKAARFDVYLGNSD